MRASARKPNLPRGRGFTLVEALVAMAVFALGLSALMPLAVTNVRANQGAGVRTQAVALAQQKLEHVRALAYDDVLALAAGTETVDGVFTRSWSFPPPPLLAGDGTDIRRVLVTVSWDLGPRGAGSVSLLTSKARY